MPKDLTPPLTQGDRDAVLTRLQESFAQGQLTAEEMDGHLEAVLTATTPVDLEPVLAALPDPRAGRTQVLAGTSGRFRRRGAWRVPRVLRVESEFGRADLDLSRAVFEHSQVDIELRLRFGGARVTVPRDAVVDTDDLRTIWKQPVHQTPPRPGDGGPRIRISGTMEFGRLKIRHR